MRTRGCGRARVAQPPSSCRRSREHSSSTSSGWPPCVRRGARGRCGRVAGGRRRTMAFGIVAVELLILAPSPFADRRDPYVAAGRGSRRCRRPSARTASTGSSGLDTLLYPNTASAYGLYDVRMLDALYSDRYFRYLKAFVVPGMYDRFAGTDMGSNEGPSAVSRTTRCSTCSVCATSRRRRTRSAAGLTELRAPPTVSQPSTCSRCDRRGHPAGHRQHGPRRADAGDRAADRAGRCGSAYGVESVAGRAPAATSSPSSPFASRAPSRWRGRPRSRRTTGIGAGLADGQRRRSRPSPDPVVELQSACRARRCGHLPGAGGLD